MYDIQNLKILKQCSDAYIENVIEEIVPGYTHTADFKAGLTAVEWWSQHSCPHVNLG